MIPCNVIGSYPAVLEKSRYSSAYFSGENLEPYEETLRNAVDAQVKAGIDIVSDGQTRADFITLYARNFRGLLMQRRPVVVGGLEYNGPVTVEDQVLVKELIPSNVKIKGIITGPYTLARYSVNRFYGNVEELAYAYADGLNQEARALDGVVDYVQLDEPEFSVEYPEYASELINVVFDGVGKPRMLHSCGDVSSVFHKLVELEVDVLLHEFAANPQLLDTVGQTDFKQKLGYGCVRSDSDKVETVDEISARMEKALKAFDEEKILMNPDCGLRNLPPEAAYRKLKNMVEARDRISNG